MRKILLSLFFITSFSANAQFCVTENGLAVCDSDKDYIVFDFDGISAEELYKRTKAALTDIYVSQKDVLSETPNEIISLSALSKEVYISGFKRKAFFDMHYNVTFKFRDGKLRIDTPKAHSIFIFDGNNREHNLIIGKGKAPGLNTIYYIYKNNGELRYPEAKQSIEDVFNNIVSIITAKVGSYQEEKW